MQKISVAITTYNGEKYLTEQLYSLLNQSRCPDEVVITDDCSTDNTVKIIEDFISENHLANWSITVNDRNVGYICNFKKALSLTTGDIVFLCDQDDVWYDNKLGNISSIFDDNNNILSISSSFKIIDENGQVTVGEEPDNHGLIKLKHKSPLQSISLQTIMHSNISPGCTMAVRRSVVDIYIANSAGMLPHDYELNLISAANNGLYYYNVPLINYRIHSHNTLGLNAKLQTRTEIAEEKLCAAEAVMKATGNKSLFDICSERLKMLKNKDKKAMTKLLLKPVYRKFYSWHERLGDILYVLKGSENH